MSTTSDWLPSVMKRLSAVRGEELTQLSTTPEAQDLLEEIVRTPLPEGASRLAWPRFAKPLPKIRVAVAIAVGLLLVGTAAAGGFALYDRYAPSADELQVQHRVADLQTLDVRRSVETPAGVKWTLVSYDSSDGLCLDVFGELASGDQAKLGGCDLTDGQVPYSMGGVDLGGQWFNVIFGQSAASSIRVTLGDGNVRRDVPRSGVWIVVVPSPPTEQAADFARVDVLDASGNVEASVQPPSLAQLRQDAQQAQSESGG